VTTIINHLSRVVRFALLGHAPSDVEEVPLWAMCVPYRHWSRVVRYDGRTFADYYTRGMSRGLRLLLPLRTFYLLFLIVWPWAAFVRALKRGRLSYWRDAMRRPDLAMAHKLATFEPNEIAWARPDYALAMTYAALFAKTPSPFFWLDDKRAFMAACEREGFPMPKTFTLEEARRRGGTFVLKEPENDLGYGVSLIEASALEDDDADLVIQERLENHAALLAAYPKDAPLSSFRVITLRDPESGEISVLRTAVRIGLSGSVVDNTAQGGIWCRVDLKTGELCAGVMKKTFGKRDRNGPIRYETHPNTGKRFVGLRIPWFDEGMKMALAAHKRLASEAITLGWDIGLAEAAPVLLEVNVWTACYDYDCQTDAFTPSAKAILAWAKTAV
jgi:Sugar-transfer associated ATP-grasp